MTEGNTLCPQIGLSKARQREVPSRASARRNPLNVVDPVAHNAGVEGCALSSALFRGVEVPLSLE